MRMWTTTRTRGAAQQLQVCNINDMSKSAGTQCRCSLIKNCRAANNNICSNDNNKLLRHYVACSMTMTRTWHVCETALTRRSALATATDRQRELPQMPPAKHFTCFCPRCLFPPLPSASSSISSAVYVLNHSSVWQDYAYRYLHKSCRTNLRG